jgi:HEAT repeat protein
VRALSEIDPAAPATVAAFARALHDKELVVRREAAASLSQLGAAAKSALPQIMKAFDDADEQVRSWVVLAAASIGKPAASVLLRALTDKSNRVCAGAAHALEEIGTAILGPKSIPLLVKALGSNDALARSWVARALAHCGPAAKSAKPALTRALKDMNEDVRLWADKALKAIRGIRR